MKSWTFSLAVDVNVNGPFYFAYYLCKRMAKHGGAQVINLSFTDCIDLIERGWLDGRALCCAGSIPKQAASAAIPLSNIARQGRYFRL